MDHYPKQDVTDAEGNVYNNHEMEHFGFYLQKGLYEEYRRFGIEGPKKGHDLGRIRRLSPSPRAALAGGGTAKRRCGVIARATIPFVEKGAGVQFYGNPDGKAVIFALPYEPAAEQPDADYDLWLCTGPGVGTLAFGLHDAARAGTVSSLPGCGGLHASG